MQVTLKAKTSFMGTVEQKLVQPVAVMEFEGQTYDISRKWENKVQAVANHIFPAAAGALSVMNLKTMALAAVNNPDALEVVGTGVSIMDRLLPLVHIVQDLAMPVGLIVATWGLIEFILGNEVSGKKKIKSALLGYVGIFFLPFIFEVIHDALQGL